MAGNDEVELAGRAEAEKAPRALWLWIALQALSFVVAPLLDPGAPTPRAVWLGFAVFWALMAVAILRHSRLAWMVAVFAAGWGLLGALPFFVALITREGDLAWLFWGMILSVGSLWALLSPGMRRWVNEAPAKRAVEPA